MNDIIRRRLANQRLAGPPSRSAGDVVSELGAMQAQDYAGAKWAIGLRSSLTNADVDRALNEGAIIRTHILRQTWHFVARDDLRWMLALSGPRVNAVNATYYRKFNLDERTAIRSRAAFERALRDGSHRTRAELRLTLRRARIEAEGTRLAFLLMKAELDGIICSGPLRGNQFTWALLDERVPRTTAIDRDLALAELARRYFASHGPATLRDYVWWSGLTVRDAKTGIELASPALSRDHVDGLTYWSVTQRRTPLPASPTAHLLPNYDEYLIAYKDRALVVGDDAREGAARIKDPFVHHIIIDGRLAGSWKRTLRDDVAGVELASYARLPRAAHEALDRAVSRYSRFLGRPAISSWSNPPNLNSP